jgi:hypothetical protein
LAASAHLVAVAAAATVEAPAAGDARPMVRRVVRDVVHREIWENVLLPELLDLPVNSLLN